MRALPAGEMNAGYSGTPLQKKLGLKRGMRAAVLRAPKHYPKLLGRLPSGLRISPLLGESLDCLHVFFTSAEDLAAAFPKLKSSLSKTGMLWISWPKKTSKLARGLNETIVREIGLEGGLVDVKVCAIDDDWSGLKFVYRVKDR